MKNIEFIDLSAQYNLLKNDIDKAMMQVLNHGKYINGPEVRAFEENLCDYAACKHSITCANGTDALTIALLALDLKEQDVIFVPSFTYIASVEAIALIGAKPFFVDVGEDYNICPVSLETAIKDALDLKLNPKVVIPVDLFGKPSCSTSLGKIIENYNLRVIYDAAQSFGASHESVKVGNFGDITTTSFFPAKPLGCYGDGGAIFTNSDELANLMRSIKNHGMGKHKYEHVNIGMNSRLDTLQAAILINKLKVLEDEIIRRNEIAKNYDEHIVSDFAKPKISKTNSYAWAQYTLRHPKRDLVIQHLKEFNIPTAVYYPIPLSHQKAYQHYNIVSSGLPNSEKFCNEVFSLPMSPYLNRDHQEYIIQKLNTFK